MMKFLGFLFLVTLGVAGYGYWKGWFEVTKSDAQGKTSYGVTIDNDKMSSDLDAMTKWAHEQLDALDQKIDELRNKAAKASNETKPEIERQIRALEAQRGEAKESLQELEKSDVQKDEAKAGALQKKLQQTLTDTPVEKGGN